MGCGYSSPYNIIRIAMSKTKFRQGNTLDIAMEPLLPLREGYKLKVGIYNPYGKALYETNYPDDGDIVKVDDTHYILHLRHATTLCFKGATTLRFVIYNENGTLVVSGENAMPMLWDEEPATKNLKL